MQDLIQDELRRVLAVWNSGRQLRLVALGHSTHVVPAHGNERAHEEPIVFRQKKAYGYVFAVIEGGLCSQSPESWEKFLQRCSEMEQVRGDLTREERAAAESLAWKAFCRGWNFAQSGFAAHRYVLIAREGVREEVGSEP